MTKIEEKKKVKSHSSEEIQSKSMSYSIWKDLPLELLKNVLACLPMHVLCRFRLVCKKWNHFISEPSFAAIHILSPHKASSILISPKFKSGIARTLLTEWQVQDPTENHFYKFSDSFVMDSYLSSSRDKGLTNSCCDLKWSKYTLAAAGELIYTMYLTSAWPITQKHIVCNLVSKSFHEIPELPRIQNFINHDIVVMSIDNATKTYKIVTLEMFRNNFEARNQSLFLYESMTLTWKRLCEVPDVGLSANSSIFMNGIFYTLFKVSSSIITFGQRKFYTIVLYSCDLVTGAWSKMDVDFPLVSIQKDHPQLVVSSGRLYMVNFTNGEEMLRLSIWQIVLETKEVVKVTKIRNVCKLSTLTFHPSGNSEMQVAMGCANLIIILCTGGHCLKFDLLKKRWQELPGHTLDMGNGILEPGIFACLVDI